MTNTATLATPLLSCHCLLIRPVLLYSSLTGLILALMAFVAGTMLAASIFDAGTQPNLVPGLGLLAVSLPLIVWMWRLLLRSQPPYEAVLTAEALQLTPRGRALRSGASAHTLPLADIAGYARTYQNNTLALRLYLRSGQLLRLSGEPRPVKLPADAPWTGLEQVADELIAQLNARSANAPALERPNFFQKPVGRVLAGLCSLAMLAGVVLMLWPGVDWTLGARLLVFPSFYLGAYGANQRPGKSS